jgi:hypothetical protein
MVGSRRAKKAVMSWGNRRGGPEGSCYDATL